MLKIEKKKKKSRYPMSQTMGKKVIIGHQGEF